MEYVELIHFYDFPVPPDVARMLIYALTTNKTMQRLNLCGFDGKLDDYMKDVLASLEDQPCLKRFVLTTSYYPTNLDPGFSWVKKLLKRNRKIQLVDRFQQKWNDGGEIDALHAFNRFYCDSELLLLEAPCVRSSLFTKALTVTVSSNDLQRTVLLLSHHADVLCKGLLHAMGEVDAD